MDSPFPLWQQLVWPWHFSSYADRFALIKHCLCKRLHTERDNVVKVFQETYIVVNTGVKQNNVIMFYLHEMPPDGSNVMC